MCCRPSKRRRILNNTEARNSEPGDGRYEDPAHPFRPARRHGCPHRRSGLRSWQFRRAAAESPAAPHRASRRPRRRKIRFLRLPKSIGTDPTRSGARIPHREIGTFGLRDGSDITRWECAHRIVSDLRRICRGPSSHPGALDDGAPGMPPHRGAGREAPSARRVLAGRHHRAGRGPCHGAPGRIAMTGRPAASVSHPRRGDHGERVRIERPTTPSPGDTWLDPTAVAVCVPDGPVPSMLNDVPLGRRLHRTGRVGPRWRRVTRTGSLPSPIPGRTLRPAP
jgi:hypothetical protein